MHEIWVKVVDMIQDQKEPTSYWDQIFHESSLSQKGCPSSLLLTFQQCLSADINYHLFFSS